ncbi:hypothetical protein ABB37_08738 [Leptomonas pyrrhocoris]|uniref:Rab-GAP TBC domain-containing protein n=1 Tax=Leptomonas pyrrhocoris TaxID=157538 RepID=A0A0N0DS42_LEPPY|nr:hypothetical protein ABB37_08738 [Leptomonas pyrrhocoris]KPA75054.1 hypothetical protein ABB37_08738 [Leptomonas pyrrhocoris]|eukprot:XP_015653493.1 hypothetical protein ABB37_08738 [Leptomonas pyrrhocoris]
MSQTKPLAYHTLSRPSRDSFTIQRNAGRASAVQHQQQRNSNASATATAGGAPGSGSSALSSADVTRGAATTSSLDTWTGFLSAQWVESVKAASPGVSTAQPSETDLVSSLQGVVARQNRVVAQLQAKLTAQRTREEHEWQQKKTQAKASERREPSKERSASQHHHADDDDVHGAVENTQVCVLLGSVLEHARLTWANAVTQHFQSAEAHKLAFTGSSSTESTPKAGAAAAISAEAAMEEERVGLPTIELLFRCLVDGINSEETQKTITSMGLLPASAWESGRLGVNQLGLLTVFQPHVQALRTFPAIVPTLEVLRECFVELHPGNLVTSTPCGPLDSTLEVAESQIDALLRMGEEAEQVASLLRESLHPSVRRLLYARALQVPLAVTDGKPMFLPQSGFMMNHFPHGLSRYITCASRHARDKVKRRFQHHYSSPKQEGRARLLQRLVLDDALTAVGDSDKYFVYTDDVEVAVTAMVVDRSLPEVKLQNTLRQLGRPDGALEHYITFLRYPEDNLILQKASACGFFPIEGSTLLLAPLCNVTGDTVEQYELMSAMTAQLWGRLQGPTPELFQCCLLFESLVQRLALPAVLHATRDLQYPPLLLAMRWMLTGFADLLDSFEVLSFWDLVLSYHLREMHRRSSLSSPVGLASAASADSTTPCALWLLPMYAAVIFVLRAPMVEACRTAAEVDVVFAAGHQLRTRSLLQGLLFS